MRCFGVSRHYSCAWSGAAGIDRHDKLLVQLARLDTSLATHRAAHPPLAEERATLQAALDQAAPRIRQRRAAFNASSGAGTYALGNPAPWPPSNAPASR